MRSWPPRSPSLTKSRTSPRRSAPTCRKSRAASASTTASGRNSCMPARDSAAPAPKDTVALIKTAQDHEAPLRIVETVAAVNDARKRAMARKVAHALGGSLRDTTVAVLGLTFKPNTDDMREAPSIPLITALQDMGAQVRAFDPVGMPNAKELLPDVTYCDGPYSCVENADAMVLVTEWEQLRALDFRRVKAAMKRPVMVDLRNIYRPDEMERHGFTYVSIGRP